MKFDIIIGNPPYNNDIYIDFVKFGQQTFSKYCTMITPAKWQNKAGIKSETFRKDIVPYISKVIFYPDCLDVFAISDISGITYYLIDKNIHDKCEVINRSEMKPIINSVELRDIRYEQTLWNIGNQIINKIEEINTKKYKFRQVGQNKKYTININKQIVGSRGQSGCWDWDNSCIKQDWIGKGGVLFTSEGARILGNPKLIVDRIDMSSGTSCNIFTTDNVDEGKSFISWLYTKFIEFLILINLGSLTMINERGFRFIPDPGPFNHIFTDNELYEKYNLTTDEINIIESLIKDRRGIK